MNDGYKITIEEWAGDNDIKLSDAQVEELVYALEVANDMSRPCGYGIDQYQIKECGKIEFLENQIDLLIRFIESKGYSITLYDRKIEEFIGKQCGTSHYSGIRKEFR